jgi:CHAT domain-containing protein
MLEQVQNIIFFSTCLCLLTIISASSTDNFTVASTAPQVLAQTGSSRSEADRLLNKSVQQMQNGEYDAALESAQQALNIYREIKFSQGEGFALGNMGLIHFELGEYDKAISDQKQHLAIARSTSDRLSEAQASGNLGITYRAKGDYATSIKYHQEQLLVAESIEDTSQQGKAFSGLGNNYSSQGDYVQAINYHQKHLAIARSIPDHFGEAQALGNLGEVYRGKGDYDQAVQYQKMSLTIKHEIRDRRGEGNSLGHLGNIYYSLGDYTKAIDSYLLQLAIAIDIKDIRAKGQSLGNLGLVYDSLGDYKQAINFYNKSLAIAQKIQDLETQVSALGNLGESYRSLGNFIQAQYNYKESLAIAQKINDQVGQANAWGNLGSVAYLQGDYLKALEYQQQRLNISQKILEPIGIGNALGNLGVIESARGNNVKAINYHRQHLANALKIGDIEGEGTAINNLGAILRKSGNLTEAEENLKAGIKIWESQRQKLGNHDAYKVSIFEQQARTYRLLQQVLISQNKTNEALEVAEQGRARAFVDLLNQRLSLNNQHGVSILEEVKLSLLQQIAQQQKATLVEYSIVYDDFKIEGKQKSHESELYIWVIKPTGEVTFRKTDLKPLWQKQNTTLSQLVDKTRSSIGVIDLKTRTAGALVPKLPESVNQSQGLQLLHNLLIKPIADNLPTNPDDRVIFIPQSSLFLVPFSALLDKQGKYLVEKHTILTVPSIQVLDLTRKQRIGNSGKKGDSLVVGNPTMPTVSLNPGKAPTQLQSLEGSEAEANAIASLLNTTPLLGNAASKVDVVAKMPQAQIIHLATHGLFDNVRGLGSAVALAPSSQDDGLLTAEEIFNFKQKLNADLVVLSACDTGVGRITGDGVIGLSRSFISAGVSSIVVSLWSIDDGSTAFFMTEFYQNYQNKNLQKRLDKATALRKAMLATKAKYPQPLQWAAFTLIGESE